MFRRLSYLSLLTLSLHAACCGLLCGQDSTFGTPGTRAVEGGQRALPAAPSQSHRLLQPPDSFQQRLLSNPELLQQFARAIEDPELKGLLERLARMRGAGERTDPELLAAVKAWATQMQHSQELPPGNPNAPRRPGNQPDGPAPGIGRTPIPPNQPSPGGNQDPQGLKPPAQNPNAQSPNGQSPNGQDPNAQSPIGQDPNAQSPNGQDPNAQSPNGQDPNAQSPNGQSPNAQSPNGQSPNGQSPNGQSPNGQSPNGQLPNGQGPNSRIPNAEPLVVPPQQPPGIRQTPGGTTTEPSPRTGSNRSPNITPGPRAPAPTPPTPGTGRGTGRGGAGRSGTDPAWGQSAGSGRGTLPEPRRGAAGAGPNGVLPGRPDPSQTPAGRGAEPAEQPGPRQQPNRRVPEAARTPVGRNEIDALKKSGMSLKQQVLRAVERARRDAILKGDQNSDDGMSAWVGTTLQETGRQLATQVRKLKQSREKSWRDSGHMPTGRSGGRGANSPWSSSRLQETLRGASQRANRMMRQVASDDSPAANGPGSAGSSGRGGSQAWLLVAWGAALAAVGILTWFLWKRGEPPARPTAVRLDRVAASLKLRSAADVVRVFHALSQSSPVVEQRWWTHRRAASALIDAHPASARGLTALAQMYERVRYAPEELAAVHPEQLQEAREALAVLART